MILKQHAFEGEGDYCEHWEPRSISNEYGSFGMSTQCGYPRESHPEFWADETEGAS